MLIHNLHIILVFLKKTCKKSAFFSVFLSDLCLPAAVRQSRTKEGASVVFSFFSSLSLNLKSKTTNHKSQFFSLLQFYLENSISYSRVPLYYSVNLLAVISVNLCVTLHFISIRNPHSAFRNPKSFPPSPIPAYTPPFPLRPERASCKS